MESRPFIVGSAIDVLINAGSALDHEGKGAETPQAGGIFPADGRVNPQLPQSPS